jgi:adenylate cyclase
LKFAELAASTRGSLRQVRLLEHRQSALSQFFSPPVMAALADGDPNEILAPRETDISVLFCDLRGFSLRSEKSAGDLLGLLRRVSDALGVLTQNILREGGVVGDFHGDAAMGFWGWPLPQHDGAVRACRAALAIRREFAAAAQQTEHPLTGFRIGIGLASGQAVAGKIGSTDQVKVTVFGPVVNLASRLEGMTKLLRAPILVDETTAQLIRDQVPSTVARLRRLVVVRPYGMESVIQVSELLPPAAEYPALSDDHLQAYEAALRALLAGDWGEAMEQLHRVPAEDEAKDFLTVFIAQHGRVPPDDWDGVIPLRTK